MSIIWGAVSLDGRPVTKEQQDILKAPALKCPIDKLSEISDNGIYMGCALQYFSKESHKETMPVHDEGCGAWFDADAVLDNREEVGRLLGMASGMWSDVADGGLLFHFFGEYKDSRLNDILGAYTFVYFDERTRKLYLVGDAVGNRFLYYRVIGNTLFYSTFIESLRPLGENTVNGVWVSYFLGESTLGVFRDLNETPICEIKRISPGSYIVFDDKGVNENQYWTPMGERKELRLKNDDEYREAFQELMGEAVKRVLRSESETGICLSGGFDSNTVAAYAAPFLEKQGRKLYTFTMIPEKGLKTEKDERNGAMDESDYVRKTAEVFKNLECSFLDMSDISLWDMDKEILDIMGQPIKSVYNMIWFQNTYKKAREKGIKLMLNGEYGNISISSGDYDVYLNELYRRHRFITFLSEARAFCLNNGYSFKYFLKSYSKEKIIRTKRKYRGVDDTFLRDDAPGRVETDLYLRKHFEDNNLISKNFEKLLEKRNDMIILRQISDFSMPLTAKVGVIERDPTRDKRVIEWCMSLPMEQFTKNGVDRRLIREYMRGVVPDHILDVRNKGVQAADKKMRFLKEWEKVRSDGLSLINHIGSDRWIDTDKLKNALTGNAEAHSSLELRRIMSTLLMLKEIEKITRK